ncbi:MAG: hypothetical protein L0H26_02900, partial [Microlunatus sp.]|nr:hypothetical protein [Microlunatus sp.]
RRILDQLLATEHPGRDAAASASAAVSPTHQPTGETPSGSRSVTTVRPSADRPVTARRITPESVGANP